MKILHTADWHTGRTLHGINRTPEIREVLQEIIEIAKTEAVDLVLVAGDIYDKRNPPADAEAAVYEFFLELAKAKIPSVVIAGNHDSPDRLDAVASLLKLSNVTVIGQPKLSKQGGVFDLNIANQRVRIAALPFVSERRIVKVAELLNEDMGAWLEKYQTGMRKLVNNLTRGFSDEQINLLMMHTTMNGSALANSEYQFHCTETYSLSSDIFPTETNYVALGHIHKAQPILDYPPSAAHYSGSVLQLDFGEQSSAKYVYIATVEAAKPTELKEIKLSAGKSLKNIKANLDSLEHKEFEISDFDGWVKLKLELEHPQPGLKDRIKRNHANILVIETEIANYQSEQQRESIDLEKMSLFEAYQAYYNEKHGKKIPANIATAFKELYQADFEGKL